MHFSYDRRDPYTRLPIDTSTASAAAAAAAAANHESIAAINNNGSAATNAADGVSVIHAQILNANATQPICKLRCLPLYMQTRRAAPLMTSSAFCPEVGMKFTIPSE